MLEINTLRVAFAIMALTLFVLFYSVTFRRTRSPYSRWWCTALALFLLGASLYLFDGSPHQVWANPLANTVLVAGASSVWAAARSLTTTPPKVWQFLSAPALTAVASAMDNPAVNDWSGGPVFLGMMCVLFSLTFLELVRLQPGFSAVQLPLAAASAFLAVYYLGRCIMFLAVGPRYPLFLAFFGSEVTTLVTMVLLIVVSFSMASLSAEQVNKELRTRANQDGLTGLLNRQGFLDLATEELRRCNTDETLTLVLADLDRFKGVNDTYGHSAGDVILQSFAAACRSTVRSSDLVGRYGGEEFVILLPGANPAKAEAIVAEINRRFKSSRAPGKIRYPTVSYGITSTSADGPDLARMIASADAAMYQAKAKGRDTVVRATNPTNGFS